MPYRKPDTPLRKGWTTGACATAASRAAWQALNGSGFPDPVSAHLPGGPSAPFALHRKELGEGWATASVIKDAGDDPDVTHGAEIVATVRQGEAGSGVTFRAGAGVGRVTLPGLPLAVGEPAINPKPREMIAANLSAVSDELGIACDVVVEIAIPGGAELAARTANGRLGIVGGLSVLGTTGIVIPYSCASWIHSIHRGIDVARAAGIGHVAGSTGRTSEEAVRSLHGLTDQALIDMGDFAGGMLKYLRRHPVPKLTIAGGFAKLAKLADGQMDLHSSRSRINPALLARWLGESGGSEADCLAASEAVSAGQVLEIAGPLGPAISTRCALGARETALAALAGDVEVDVLVIDRAGNVLAHVT